MDFITKLLAQLLDSFKVKNPKLFGVITLVLLMIQYGLTQGGDMGIFVLTDLMQTILQWVTFALALLTNMGTFNILNKKE